MYFDLEYTSRTNGEFKHKLVTLAREYQDLSDKAMTRGVFIKPAQDKLREFLRHCKFNPAFLLPHYYPKYPRTDPMSLRDFPFAFHLMSLNIGGFTVVRGSRQIAKSTTFCARQRLNAHIIPKFKSMYIAPKSTQVDTYADRFKELEAAFRYKKINSHYRQNLKLKEYPNGSGIKMFNVDTQVSNVRGNTADEMLYDEYQDFDPTFQPELDEIQSGSLMPVTIFAGTSLTTDSALEARYMESSQGVWMIPCPGCNHENMPTVEGKVMDMIQPKGCCCSACGKLLDVTTGFFVHTDDHAFRMGYYGFHIPQIIVPAVVNNEIRWSNIYEKSKTQDTRKFLQENLGIPTQEGEREITEGELRRLCVLGRNKQPLWQKAKEGRYHAVFSGCDWGGSDYDMSAKTRLSYTVHVIIGLNRDGTMDILHMKKYEGMNYTATADDIVTNHRAYNGLCLAADFGVGYAYNTLIRERMAVEQHFIYKYTGPNTIVIKESDTLFNMYSLNRTESITSLYYAMKSLRIRAMDWDVTGAMLSDCMNMIRTPHENDQSGVTGFKYRKHGAKSDDVLHALNFAYVTARIFLMENIVTDVSLLRRMKETMSTNVVYGGLRPESPYGSSFSM
jgi:hypothetical protein